MSGKSIKKERCQWLNVGRDTYCTRKAVDKYCSKHTIIDKKPKPCRNCGKGSKNYLSLCRPCGYDRINQKMNEIERKTKIKFSNQVLYELIKNPFNLRKTTNLD